MLHHPPPPPTPCIPGRAAHRVSLSSPCVARCESLIYGRSGASARLGLPENLIMCPCRGISRVSVRIRGVWKTISSYFSAGKTDTCCSPAVPYIIALPGYSWGMLPSYASWNRNSVNIYRLCNPPSLNCCQVYPLCQAPQFWNTIVFSSLIGICCRIKPPMEKNTIHITPHAYWSILWNRCCII